MTQYILGCFKTLLNNTEPFCGIAVRSTLYIPENGGIVQEQKLV